MVITRFLGWRNSKKKAAWNLIATYLGNKHAWITNEMNNSVHLSIFQLFEMLPDVCCLIPVYYVT